ncbi:hypothetical protein [Kouleothrix sp.]|uniref:hypothetical protein n=1 Tax=Kouleothrix sp. TaxID=2779161 RepID=UPI00391C18C4
MPDDTRSLVVDAYLREYEKLKDEQIARIGFRDNLIYATLVATGGLLSFALASPSNIYALLLLPLAGAVLGWTYLNNDRKISSIGRYIRSALLRNLRAATQAPDAQFFGWELTPQIEPGRLWRKILQLAVNIALFVGSGLVALAAFFLLSPAPPRIAWWVAGADVVMLVLLLLEIVRDADIRHPGRR